MTRCFVIGPIGDRLAPPGTPGRDKYEHALEVYSEVVQAACAQVGLTPVRADQISTSGEITEQVFRHLYEDEIVIADVSDGNPNVMYELGLRHTRDLLTIQIGEYGQLPFDVQAIRTIQFSRSERGLIDARNRLVTALNIGLAEGSDPVTATKIWLRSGDANGAALALTDEETGLDIDVEEVEPDGLVDALAGAETSFPRITERMELITHLIEDLGAVTQDSFQEMTQMAESGSGSAVERLTFIKKFADRLTGIASSMEEEVQGFDTEMDEIDGNVNGVLAYLANHYSEYDSDTDEFLDGLIGLASSARESMASFSDMDAGLKTMGDISKLLRAPSRRLNVAVRRMVTKTRLMDEWEAAAIRLKNKFPTVEATGEDDTQGSQ